MNTSERIDTLYEASELINQAIEHIEAAVDGTSSERSAQAYIIAHLRNWANGENPYDETIPKLIENIERDGE